MLKLQLERDESEERVTHYTMGAGLEAMRREASSFYHYNHLGTTLALTGADEAVTDTYRHDAWGVLLASTGSAVNPHTYVGRERYYRMPNAQMYHLGFRDYAQGLGRFTTVDPARWGRNWRVNTANRPAVFVDPRGLQGQTSDCCARQEALDHQAGTTLGSPTPSNCQTLNELLYQYLHYCRGFRPPLDKKLYPRPVPYPEPPSPPPPGIIDDGAEFAYLIWHLKCHSYRNQPKPQPQPQPKPKPDEDDDFMPILPDPPEGGGLAPGAPGIYFPGAPPPPDFWIEPPGGQHPVAPLPEEVYDEDQYDDHGNLIANPYQ